MGESEQNSSKSNGDSRSKLPSPAMIVALISLFVALCGSAYAVGGPDSTPNIPANSVGAAQIKKGAVGASEIAPNAVKSKDLAPGAVTPTDIAPGAVTETKVATGAVSGPKIKGGAVVPDKIAPGAITAPAIGPGAVTSPAIAPAAVTPGKIAVFPNARVTRNSAQSITGVGYNQVQFNQESFDTQDVYDPGEPTKLTAPIDGFYDLAASITWAADPDGYRQLLLIVNGTNVAGYTQTEQPGSGALSMAVASTFPLHAGDEVEVWVAQVSNFDPPLQQFKSLDIVSDTYTAPRFSMFYVAPYPGS